MKLALCQMHPNAQMQDNLEQSLQCIREASKNGADLILFPEVQLTPFFRSIRVRMHPVMQ